MVDAPPPEEEPREDYRAFAAALHEAMNRKRMNSSALARAVWGTVKDYRGYNVAKNRDRITFYLQGKSAPRAETLRKLAQALDVPLEHLESVRPGGGPGPLQPAGPTPPKGVTPLRITQQAGATKALFEISTMLRMTTIVELIKLIEADTAADANSGVAVE